MGQKLCAVTSSGVCIIAQKLDEIGGDVMPTHHPSMVTELSLGDI